jgi:hypothetical protein
MDRDTVPRPLNITHGRERQVEVVVQPAPGMKAERGSPPVCLSVTPPPYPGIIAFRSSASPVLWGEQMEQTTLSKSHFKKLQYNRKRIQKTIQLFNSIENINYFPKHCVLFVFASKAFVSIISLLLRDLNF